MQKYLAIYHGAASDDDKKQVSPQESQAFMEAWAAWANENKRALVDPGSPLYRKKVLTANGIQDIKDTKTGYAIVQAASHDDAVKIFQSHPIYHFLKVTQSKLLSAHHLLSNNCSYGFTSSS